MTAREAASSPASVRLRGWRIACVLLTRLRFLAVFALVFIVIGKWETLKVYCKRLTMSSRVGAAISADTEFFCPMDPGVISDWPSKCPICNMTLVRHKKGDSAPLPDGVVARMQFTPYRLWLGGIRTSAVDYKSLTRSITLNGKLDPSEKGKYSVLADGFPDELANVEVGTPATVASNTAGKTVAFNARVTSIEPKRQGELSLRLTQIEGTAAPLSIPAGGLVRVNLRISADAVAPFRDQPSVPPAIKPAEAREIYRCMEHRDITSLSSGVCPKDQSALMRVPLRENERVGWWCPMHPEVTAPTAGASCPLCGGMALVPRRVSYRRPGTVLAVPAEAVIDDGKRALVYCDVGGGMFDARVVKVGPRFGDAYPVISGLEPGDRVATQGAFLIDAETRLNPGIAAGYFGSSVPVGKTPSAQGESWLDELPQADRAGAVAQNRCPVTGKPLGSMGTPLKVAIKGRDVFLCCSGCTASLQKDPERYLKAISPQRVGTHP